MEFKWHFLSGFVISYILVYFFKFSLPAGLIIFVASWLIDIDHYPWYVFEMKKWNPLKALRWHREFIPRWYALSRKERDKFRRGIFVFHDLFFWIILVVLAFIYSFFFWILIGVAIHMAVDFIDLVVKNEPLYSKVSFWYVIKKNRGKKKLTEW